MPSTLFLKLGPSRNKRRTLVSNPPLSLRRKWLGGQKAGGKRQEEASLFVEAFIIFYDASRLRASNEEYELSIIPLSVSTHAINHKGITDRGIIESSYSSLDARSLEAS